MEVHRVASVLNAYGRRLYDRLQSAPPMRGFATIAQFFGTAAVPVILAHLYRGMLRSHALDRMLRDRLARGFDLTIVAPRAPARRAPAEATAAGQSAPLAPPLAPPPPTQEAEAAARAAAARRAESMLARRIAASEPLSFATMPSQEQIDAEVRRTPVGRTIVLICRDFGVAPFLCDAAFWNRLFDTIRLYGGSLGQLVPEMRRREHAFDRTEVDANPDLERPELTREGARRVLGLFIGEPLPGPSAPPPAQAAPRAAATPGAPVAVAATGPP